MSTPSAPSHTIKRTLSALMVVLAVAFLAWIVWHTPWSEVWTRARGIPWWVWCVAILGMLCSYGARAARLTAEWYSYAQRHGHVDGGIWSAWLPCLRLVILHNASVNFLPMRAGELAYPMWLKDQWGVPIANSVASLFLLRVQDVLVLLLLACWAYSLHWGVGATGAWVMLVLAFWRIGQNPTSRSATPSLSSNVSTSMFSKLRAALTQSRGGLWAWMWSLVNWCIKISALGLLLWALLPPEATDTASIAAQPITPYADWTRGAQAALGGEMAALWPIQPPAGLGTYELGVWLGQRVFGSGLTSLHDAVRAFSATQQQLVLGAGLVVHTFVLCCSAISAVSVLLWQKWFLPPSGAAHQPAQR